MSYEQILSLYNLDKYYLSKLYSDKICSGAYTRTFISNMISIKDIAWYNLRGNDSRLDQPPPKRVLNIDIFLLLHADSGIMSLLMSALPFH